MGFDRILLVLAAVLNGMIAGATLDQAIKQLPARHTIGAAAYSAYSQAADLSQGVPWYAALGIGTALVTLVAAVVGLRARPAAAVRLAWWVAAAATVGHLAVTAVAAPTNFSQREAANAEALADVLDTFARLNALRAVLVGTALVAVAAVLLAQLRPATTSRGGGDDAGR